MINKECLQKAVCGLCLLSLLISGGKSAKATTYAPDYTPPSLMEGPALTLTWTGPEDAPLAVSWKDDTGTAPPVWISPGASSVSLTRNGYGQIPTRLLLIPAQRGWRPQERIIHPETLELTVKFEPIPPDEVWIWGVTPENPCLHSPGNAVFMSLSARMITQSDRYERLNGLFAWFITRNPDHGQKQSLYFIPDYQGTLRSMQSETLEKAPDLHAALCHTYHGGPCLFTLGTTQHSWGTLHKISFTPEPNFYPARDCPI